MLSAGAIVTGELLRMTAPRAPVAFAVSPQILAERTGAGGGAIVVFPALGEAPFRVPAEAIEPLERRTLADADLTSDAGIAAVRKRAVEPMATEPVEIENAPVGPLPLWGLG